MNVTNTMTTIDVRDADQMKHPLKLGAAEMEVLRFVAEHGPVTVREVADHLAQTKGHVRTTVLNSMERLRRKGFLSRKKVNGLFQYVPVKDKRDLFQRLLKGFVEAAFGGSHDPLIAYFAEQGKMTPGELRMLRKVAARLETSEE